VKIRILATNKIAKIVAKVKASKHKTLAKDNSQVATKALQVMQAKVSKVQVRRRVPKVAINRLANKPKNSPLTNLAIKQKLITNKKKVEILPVKRRTERAEKLATIPVMQKKKVMQATMQVIPAGKITRLLIPKRKSKK